MSSLFAANTVHPTHPKWRAVRVADEEGVAYLNRMFGQGWFVPEFGLDDISHFILTVPVQTPRRTVFRNEHEVAAAQGEPVMTIVLLRKGTARSIQIAVVNTTDEAGYEVKSSEWPERGKWKLFARISLENGTGAYLFGQRES